MIDENEPRLTSISKARTLEEIAEFWNTHSPIDYGDQIHEVEFEVRAPRRRVALDPELYTQVEAQAKSRGVRAETLINLWVAERLKASYTAMPAGG